MQFKLKGRKGEKEVTFPLFSLTNLHPMQQVLLGGFTVAGISIPRPSRCVSSL